MSNVQIPNLPASVSLNGTEQLEAVQAGTSVRVTTDEIATYTQAQYPAPGVSSVATTAPITGGTITTTGTIGLQAAGVDNSYLASMAGGTVKANVTGSPAQPSDASVSSVLDVVGSTRGTVLYRGVSDWSPLLPGSANDILSSGGGGADPTWQSISGTLDAAAGSTQGSILYRDASTWTELPPGTSGQILQTNGGGANPSWVTVAGSGTVTQVNTGTGLTGGPITISGTISIANTGVAAGSYGTSSAVPTVTVNAQGQITSATDTAIAIATSQITSGTLGIDRGGTGLSSVPTNGQIDIGNGTGFTRTTLTPSTGISISNGAGSISIANSGVLSFSAGTTGLTPSTGTTGAVTLAGTLNVANGGTGATSLTGYVYGNGTGAFTASTTIPNSGLQNSSLTIGSTPISLGNTASSIAGLTSLTLTQDPINPLDAATKQYVDATIEGLNIHAPAEAATTANLTATYNNGTSGVGATLTNSGTQAAFAVDGYTAALNDRILVKDQSTAAQNGVYTVTTVGSGSTNWVLTRATDMNTSGSGADQLGPGDYVFVVNGTQNAATAWVVTTPLPITIGSTAITFVQFAGASTYTAGTGLTLIGTQFSITNTGVSAASYGSASSVPAITINAQGQITSATNTSIAIAASQITSGTLGVARGGTGTGTAFTAGSLVFAGASGVYSQDNANLFWDDSNNYLGIGTATPAAPLNVSVSTSGDAVRITQTGAGNALVVEDSANPDATPFAVNANGQVLIGRTTAPFGTTQLGIEQIGANTQAAAQDFLKNRAGATIASGDGVGQLRFWGYDGTSNEQVAAITAIAEGTITTGDVPGRIVFSTRQQSTASVSERMRIDSNGNVGIGTSSPTATLSVVANTSSDAVRITQTGAGNALVVEDSANPDSTPFVVDASGFVIQGYTANLTGAAYQSNSGTPFSGIRWNAASTGPSVLIGKSRSATIGTNAIVLSGDTVGSIIFTGDDGAAFINAASIVAAVDGTPGTNDMPGRLVFSTTADGASSPTERMRISNEGSVGVGAVSQAQNTLRVTRNITGSTFSAGIVSDGQVQSGVTSRADYFLSAAACAAGTYGTINGFQAQQSTFTGTVAIQNGYRADASLIGATTNTGFIAENTAAITAGKTAYGFYSAVNTATGGGTTWGFYAGGTAANYFAGQVQLGAGTAAAPALSTTGDTNTGIFFPAADTVAISAAGTEDFRIGPAGQIGLQGANYGTSGQVLTSNGSAAAPSWQTASSTGALKNVQVFTSSGTYTRTSGVTTAVVVAVGAGGGGKGATGKTAGGNGGNGGTTSFGSHVTALGGTGSTGTTGGAGGTGGTGATIAIKGQGGGAGFAFAVGSNIGSLGGSAGGQGGGAGVRNNSAGNAGVRGGGGSGGADTDGTVCAEGSYAGGGGGQGETCIKYITSVGATETVTIGAGGTAGTGTRAGGAGGAGYIIVYEYS